MISYVTIGTNDYERAFEFFDAFLPLVGGSRAFEAPSGQFFGFPEGPYLGVFKPHDGGPATGGNGTMIALKVPSEDRVQEVHARALELGATDDGAPGPRGERGFYAAYFRDADGNKFCVYHM